MPRCIHCHDWFCPQTMSSPREDCECGSNTSVDDARRDYFSTEREPDNDELEEKRSER